MLAHISTAILAFASAALATNPIIRRGANFVDADTGARFEILGVAYQPGSNAGFNMGADPLSDGETCLRDAIVMQQLGINVIRVYNLDPSINHDECASIFNAAGIYMLLDVNTPQIALNAEEPWTTYTGAYLEHIFSVVEAFAPYPNLLAFVAGNENINDVATGRINPPYVKAVIRDLKEYIAKNIESRQIPVGYAAAQIQDTLLDQWNYFRCSVTGEDDDPSITDFFALNSYSWCGNSSFHNSGYDNLTTHFADTNVPLFFGEYGCNTFAGAVDGGPRPFTEVGSLYGQPMRGVFSGGNVFEYTQETNEYGLVKVQSNKTISLRQDYINLQTQFNELDWSQVTATNASATAQSAPRCSSSLIVEGLTSNFTLPATPDNGTEMINNGVRLNRTPTTVSVTATSLPTPVRNVQGVSMDWELKVLSNDESNAPSNNTAGGSGTGGPGTGDRPGTASSSSSGSFAAPTAMPKAAGVIAGGLLMGAMIL